MRKHQGSLSALLLVVMLLGLLSGCNTQQTPPPATTAPPTTAPTTAPAPVTPTKPDTLTIAYQLEFKILDPYNTGSSADSAITASLFDSLIAMDVKGNIYPLVAKTWDVSADGLTYTFHLRDDVLFHNGSKLTSEDVAYSFERMKTSSYRTAQAQLIDRVEIVDEYTINFILPNTVATFLMEIATSFTCYSKQATEALGAEFSIKPVGCGPYRFVSMDSSQVVLEAFEDYYDGVAPINKIVYKVIPDASTALVALENGEVDLSDYVPAASYSIVEANQNLTLLRVPYTRLMQFIMNVNKAPFDNVLVRQAIAHAIDKELLIDMTLEGYGSVAYGQINDRYIGYHPDIDQHAAPYDPERGKELLAEAGYPGGQGLPSISFYTIEMFRKQVEIIQAMLRDIGILLEIEIVELSAYLDMQTNHELYAALMSWTGGPDASIYERQLTGDGPNNGANFHDDEIAQWFKDSLMELDLNKRKEIFLKIFTKQLELVPYVPLYFPDTVVCGRNDLDFATLREYLVWKGNLYSYK